MVGRRLVWCTHLQCMAAGLLELEGQVDGSVDSSSQAVDVQLLKAMGTCIQLRGVPCKHMYYIITCIDIDIAYTPYTGVVDGTRQ